MNEWAPPLRVKQFLVILEALEIRLSEEVRVEVDLAQVQIACLRCPLSISAAQRGNFRKKLAETGRVLVQRHRLSQEFVASKQKAEIFRDIVNQISESTIPIFLETAVSSPEVTRAWQAFSEAQKIEAALAGPLETEAGALGCLDSLALPRFRQLIESVAVWRGAASKSHEKLKIAVRALIDFLAP